VTSLSIVDLQNAIDGAIANVACNTIVLVGPGTRVGSLDIDLAPLQKHVIVASEDGPEATTIDATTAVGWAVHIHGAGTLGSRFTFGWHQANEVDELSPFDPASTNTAHARGWQGFGILWGKAEANIDHGASIVVEDTTTPIIGGVAHTLVELRGNYIHGNVEPFPFDGAGVALVETGEVDIVSNDISECGALRRGAGVGVLQDPDDRLENKITIAKNYIHDNVLESKTAGLATRGGGIYAGHFDVDVCTNYIFRNRAHQGAGVFLDFSEGTGLQFFYVEGNDVYLNGPIALDSAVQTAGAGIMVSTEFPGPPQDRWQLGLVRNRIYQNGEIDPPSDFVEYGGGLFVAVDFVDALGPFGSFQEPPFGQVIGKHRRNPRVDLEPKIE